MLSSLSIKTLYALALAEGEGVGTGYEYFAKRLVLRSWLAKRPSPKRILIAGLPEKYGSSLDFLLLAQEFGAAVEVVDERPSALEKAQRSLAQAQTAGLLLGVAPTFALVNRWGEMGNGRYDLILSSETVQRLGETERQDFVTGVMGRGTGVALFTPNGDNPAHVSHSGLSGVTLAELRELLPTAARSGYIDMPPFPPGITRTDDQREQATSGKLEAFAMWGLGFYAQMEWLIPTAIRRKQSHIVYSLVVV
jgi:hypothetical protein